MKKSFFYVLLVSIALFQTALLNAQTLPPDQPEQDACNALQICGNFTTPYSYDGTGLVLDLPTTPCGSPEANSVWFRLTVTSPGIIVFKIVPFDTLDDYDFAIVDITNGSCSNISQSQVIRCNFNNNEQPNTYYYGGVVGLNTTSTLTTVFAGAYGQPFLEEITANTGDEYLIMVNNFGHDNCLGSCPGAGFTLDFTGSTAGFNQPPPPQFASVLPSCSYKDSVTVLLTQNTLCSSIAADGSDFYLTPSGTVQSARGLGCSGTMGYTKKVRIYFNSSLPDGDYEVHAKVGTDNNTLLGLCQAALQLPDSVQFHVGHDPIKMSGIDSPACLNIKLHLNSPVLCASIAPNGSDFKVVGPSPVTISAASGIGCSTNGFTQTVNVLLSQPIAVDGVYQLVAQVGTDNNTLIDSCGRIVLPGDSKSFRVKSFNGLLQVDPGDTITCQSKINLTSVNHGAAGPGGFHYTWTPTTGIQNPNSPNTSVSLTPGYHPYVLSTIDSNGCYLRDSSIIVMSPFEGSIDPQEANVCDGKSIRVQASDGVSYKWADNPQIAGTPAGLSCTDCANPLVTLPIGNHTLYVQITNNKGCFDTLSSLIHVLPNPVVVSLPSDTTIDYGDGITLKASGALNYLWKPVVSLDDPQSPTPFATPKVNTSYIVMGFDKYNCSSEDTSVVKINYRSPVFVPSAFSPNGDGNNDVFKIEHLTFQKILTFNVYDRWGNMVFHTTNPNVGWDGTYKGKPAPEDTYNYYIELAYPDNFQQVLKGTVTLIR